MVTQQNKWGLKSGLMMVAIAIMLLLNACRSTPNPTITLPANLRQPPPTTAVTTLANLQTITLPENDRAAIAASYQGIPAPRVAATSPPTYQTDDTAPFWTKNFATQENRQITAVLRYQSADLLLWVEEGVRVTDDAIATAATHIEDDILPTSRAIFGPEWTPGVDGDPRLTILHVADVGGSATAYFDFANQYVTAVNPYSNQREMLTVGMATAPLGSDTYFSAIAHELQHLIQWHSDGNEDGWLNEGVAELAARLNGYPLDRGSDYVSNPDIQLTDLSQQPDVISQHYAAAALFTTYFYEQYGQEAIQALARHPENGRSGINATLAELGSSQTFTDLFADWLAANAAPASSYRTLTLPDLQPQPLDFGETVTDSVHQFGADYYRLPTGQAATAVFTGTQQVPLFPTTAASGSFVWMSYPADESAVTLTRAFDLTPVANATLTFQTWYDLETGWDYAYTAVSTDNGDTWTLLETAAATRDNPQGNSIGPGYTGSSDGWLTQQADLTPFAGQQILLRFLVLTDAAVHHTGFLLDDIAIPEIAFADDMETGTNGWEAAGFVRVSDTLPQSFIVQSVLIGQNGVDVQRLALDATQQGTFTLPPTTRSDELILIVAGTTPVTRETAVYQLTLLPTANP